MKCMRSERRFFDAEIAGEKGERHFFVGQVVHSWQFDFFRDILGHVEELLWWILAIDV